MTARNSNKEAAKAALPFFPAGSFAMLYPVKSTQDRKWQVVNANRRPWRMRKTLRQESRKRRPNYWLPALTAVASQRRSLQSHSDIGTIIENIRLAGLNGRPNDALA
jgi:hypothetical protein